jgi:hypothetical protein
VHVLIADVGFVLNLGEVQRPVATVVDTPMTANRTSEVLDAHLQATELVTQFGRLLAGPQATR